MTVTKKSSLLALATYVGCAKALFLNNSLSLRSAESISFEFNFNIPDQMNFNFSGVWFVYLFWKLRGIFLTPWNLNLLKPLIRLNSFLRSSERGNFSCPIKSTLIFFQKGFVKKIVFSFFTFYSTDLLRQDNRSMTLNGVQKLSNKFSIQNEE